MIKIELLEYIGEGAVHMVFKDNNTYDHSCSEDAKILRLKKRLISTVDDGDQEKYVVVADSLPQRLRIFCVRDEVFGNSVAFIARYFETTFTKAAVLASYAVQLPADPIWWTCLKDRVEGCRPSFRTTVSVLDERCREGTVQEHGAWQPVLRRAAPVLFEIKPKWGFLPPNAFKLLPANSVKLHACRFCLHQHYRSTLDASFVRSQYCPLALFGEH